MMEVDITADDCRSWIRHSEIFVPCCIAREDIHYDVDENLWLTDGRQKV